MPATVRPSRVTREELRAFYRALSALARTYQFRDRVELCDEDVTVSECYALEAVIRGNGVSVTGVAAELKLDKSTASRTIEALEKRGLVVRAADPEEHRAWHIAPTERGRRLHDRISSRVMDDYRPILARVSPTVRRRLVDLMEEIAEATRKRLDRSASNPSRT